MKPKIWTPNPGPQTDALNSKADVLLYGGAAGGGKTDLLLGAAVLRHHRSIIFRRETKQLQAIEERSHELFDGRAEFNGQSHCWRFNGGQRIFLGGVQHLGDERKYQGHPHDLKAFDEVTHFTERQFRYLCGWNRPNKYGQRCRVIAASNPPTEAEEEWVLKFWAPWLDPNHPRPAKPGELRWFTTIDGQDQELESGIGFRGLNGTKITPLSRTFIPARVEDNPLYRDSSYIATLQALPEPLRSKLLYGSFLAGRDDNPFQVIPSAWVVAAQTRWRLQPHSSEPMVALGVDVARGGKDKTVLSPRHGSWFASQRSYPGTETPDGPAVAQLVLLARQPLTVVNVDVVGVGSSVYDWLRDKIGGSVVALQGAAKSIAKDKSGQLSFVNKRAEWYWKLREALDPDTGENLAIPPDDELRADLTAPTWRLRSNGIQVESKEDLSARIQRSPDKGDALVYAHAVPFGDGTALLEYYKQQANAARASAGNGQPPTVQRTDVGLQFPQR